MVITGHAEARAMLADARYVPPPVRQDAPAGTLAWLRSRVSRFSSGEAHAQRRRRLEELLKVRLEIPPEAPAETAWRTPGPGPEER